MVVDEKQRSTLLQKTDVEELAACFTGVHGTR